MSSWERGTFLWHFANVCGFMVLWDGILQNEWNSLWKWKTHTLKSSGKESLKQLKSNYRTKNNSPESKFFRESQYHYWYYQGRKLLYNKKVRYINLPNMSELFQTIVFWCKRLTLENIKRLLYNGSSFANGGSLSVIIGISSSALYHIFGQTISFQVLDCLHDYLWHNNFPLTKKIFSGSGLSGSSWSS